MVLRICVLGVTQEAAERLLETLCRANADDIYRRRHDVGIMNDGTVLSTRLGILFHFISTLSPLVKTSLLTGTKFVN